MITKENFPALLTHLGFASVDGVYTKSIFEHEFTVDVSNGQIDYPKGLKVWNNQTRNFSFNENFVVFECVHRLIEKGYQPHHIELEPRWKFGHEAKSARADIFVRNQQDEPLLMIECKTAGREFEKAWKDTQADGAQLFSYLEQEKATQFLCLYASDYDDKNLRIESFQRIISVKDNQKILDENPKLISFANATNNKERFKVWKTTYQEEFSETGVFESNILAYNIGKEKYTLADDTDLITSNDIKGAYHTFRTILRKHNVSRRENAFEVLVNLFLCKIVDEIENQDDLKFYWKGIAYDNYFDLVDRLQSLYKTGMEQFLNQDIVYVSNSEIDNAFWAVKQKRNATKLRIKEIFRELKFYKGLDFEFIKVFNKEYFDKNAKILLEIIKMWQGFRLTSSDQNQFLGDMFEYFLDNGIKQSEGQFFTPVPICKFIVSSLPLECLISTLNEPLKVIDYASGSGHFLTEYAVQIPPLLKTIKHTDDPSQYFKNIYGIEKEDRLAKVAKVSAFMYGFNDINIIDADALVPHPDIKEAGFNVLIANPPFAVEDFLSTIDEAYREKYTLMGNVGDLGNKNIQCFFLERAYQLLSGNGIMGVIVPSSILSNSDTMHIATREILLKYFDFISIVELGNNTFGKTGTNTVILFLRRKAQRPEPQEQYWNRTLDFFDNWGQESSSGGGAYLDVDVVRRYCLHIDVDYTEYQTLLIGSPSDALLAVEMFRDYRDDFDSSTELKKLSDNKAFKAKPKAEQQSEIERRFVQYLVQIEKNKLYYFMLANSNPCAVVLVKSPADNKEQKQFLGYEWSGAKGSEGVRYNGGDTVYDINTPMFDPKNRDNQEKISFVIRQNFLGQDISIPKHLQAYVSTANLADLLDFTRKDFNKAFSLTPKKNLVINTQWEIVKLENIMRISRGASPRPINKFITDDGEGVNWIKIGDVKQGAKYIEKTEEKITLEGAALSRSVKAGDFILSNSMSFGRPYIMKIDGCIHDGWLLLTEFDARLNKDFLYEILSYKDTQTQFSESAAGGVVQNLNTERVKSTKIPLPPIHIQEKIVAECESVDKHVGEATAILLASKKAIETAIQSDTKDAQDRKLGAICNMQAGKFVSASDIYDKQASDMYPCFGGNGLRGYTKTFTHEGIFPLIGRQGALCGNICLASGQFHATEHAVVVTANSDVDIHWLYHKLIALNLNQYATGAAQPGLSVGNLKQILVSVPSLENQVKIVQKIKAIESEINAAQAIIDAAPEQKQAILRKYL